jgi:predicted ATPase
MGPVVRSLILKRFRSIRAGQIIFDNPTFLVGRNGSGKSNIADAFAFLAEAMDLPLHEVLDRRGGIANLLHKASDRTFSSLGIAIEVDLRDILRGAIGNFDSLPMEIIGSNILTARYAFEIKTLPDYQFEVDREQCVLIRADGTKEWFERHQQSIRMNIGPTAGQPMKLMVPGSLALPGIAGFTDHFFNVLRVLRGMRVYSIEPPRLREMQDPDSGASLRRDGANAASVLEDIKRRMPQDIPRIEQFLSTIVPGVSSVSTIRHGQKLTLEFSQQWEKAKSLTFEAFNISDGTLRAFGLLLAVFQREKPSLIVVEEPESSIHPAAAGAVLDLLRHATKQMQVIVSTHSPEILDAKWIQDQHLRVVSWQKGVTSVSQISDMSRKALQDHLMQAGELMRSEALETDPLFEDAPERQANLFEEVV